MSDSRCPVCGGHVFELIEDIPAAGSHKKNSLCCCACGSVLKTVRFNYYGLNFVDSLQDLTSWGGAGA